MRVNQFIAAGTNLSRRAADTAVAAGEVKINGQTATLGQTVGTGDTVTLKGQIVIPRTHHTYLMLHKPAGYVSSRAQQGNDPTLYDLLPDKYRALRIAGRLDRDSSGLIILSDDGDFIQGLTHPSGDKSKVYELDLSRELTPADQITLRRGVELTDGLSQVEVLSAAGRHVTVALSEGRNRQLRRTFGALGYTVESLHRTDMGPFRLGSLAAGQWTLTDAKGHKL